MKDKFDFSIMEELLQKAAKDETGELPSIINDLIMLGFLYMRLFLWQLWVILSQRNQS
jgi:hypothetical protein